MQTRVPFVWFSELSRFSMISFCNNIEQSNDALIIYVFFFQDDGGPHYPQHIFPTQWRFVYFKWCVCVEVSMIFHWMRKVWLQHPTNRASFFCLFEWGGEEEAPPEWRQTFEVAAAQISGLNQSYVKQVYSSASTRYFINRWSQPSPQ